MTQRYTVFYTPAARTWLNEQDEKVQRHVAGAVSSAAFNPRETSDHLYRQDIWQERTDCHEARRIKLRHPAPGIRIIFYTIDEVKKMIIVKIAFRDADPYEDGR